MTSPTPIIGIICSQHRSGDREMQSVLHYYTDAVHRYMEVGMVLLPGGMAAETADALVARLDGVLLTGSRTNVHPSHYGVEPSDAHPPFDEARDETALNVIRAALAQNVPLLAICRGLQELNVACGGTLAAAIHTIEGRLDHRDSPDCEPDCEPNYDNDEARYRARHEVRFPQGGYFHKLLGAESAQVNSLHGQGIDRLGTDLVIEATAPDGTIEAVRHTQTTFCLGVQWHPEKQHGENIISPKLFGDFDRAIRRG